MKLLILGGTRNLGRHAVDAALAAGHEVTLFNRGTTNPDLFPDLERLRGDRAGDLSALRGRTWDAVIDPSGYRPSDVRASCTLLRGAVGHYTFISSISAYADPKKADTVETDALAELPAGAGEEVTGSTYGALKALCETEVLAAFPNASAIVRAGLIFGPHDPTERSTYWPERVTRGGETLAPGRPDRPVQLVDGRDLGAWLVRLGEARTSGVFNATGPAGALTMERFLEACRAVARSDARFTWVDEAFLIEQKVGPFSELPLWVPEDMQAFETVNIARAIAAGLTFRPLADTVRDTLAWVLGLPPEPRTYSAFGITIQPALTREREAALLAAWRERTGASGEAQPATSGASA